LRLRIAFIRRKGGKTMKKLAFVIGLIFLIALAVPATAGGNGALVYKDVWCPIYTGEYGTMYPAGFGILFTEDSMSIENGNNMKRICHGHLTENFPSEAVLYRGTLGSFPYFEADAWQVVITPGGEVTLTARLSVV
jgi:hypothetical protein